VKSQGAADRPYRMVARAESAAATGARILDAAIELFWAERFDRITLDRVAQRAGVTVQTVIRRFGGKEQLFAAAVERETERVREERAAPIGDTAAAVRALMDHYERLGDRVMRTLAEEHAVPGLHEIVEHGRREHRAWCELVFAPALDSRAGAERARLLAQLVAVCDVYTWKLLRRDAGLGRRQAELALVELLEPVLGGGR
jgi:AcrR family transcriptional regulator